MKRSLVLVSFIVFSICSLWIFVKAEAANIEKIDTVSIEDKDRAAEAVSQLPNSEPLPELEAEHSDTIAVKFTQGANPEDVLRRAGINPVKIEEINFRLPSEKLAALSQKEEKGESLGKGSENWYWYIGKNYKEIPSEQVEDEFNLGFRITLAQGITIAEAINKLKGNPSIEYAMPNDFALE